MGQHKTNPKVQLAKDGKLPPKEDADEKARKMMARWLKGKPNNCPFKTQ